MHRFTLEQPTTLDEVSSLLLAHEDSRIIAGGTALTLLMKEGLLRPSRIVALRRVPDLVTLEEQNGLLRLGSMVTQHTLEISPLIARKVPIVAEAASKVGNIRVRAVSTVGGSLSEADYQSDLAPPLAVLNARVHIYGKQGSRDVPVTEFLRGMYEVDLQGGEIVTGVDIPVPAVGSGTAYLKHVTGPITDRPCLGVAAIITLDKRSQCRALRIAISSVMGFSSRPLVVDAAALGLIGRPLNDDAINAVAEAAFTQVDPPDDLRGSAWYRKQMTRVFARRALALARTRLLQR